MKQMMLKNCKNLMVRDDIAMLLYQSGFGNECLTVDTDFIGMVIR